MLRRGCIVVGVDIDTNGLEKLKDDLRTDASIFSLDKRIFIYELDVSSYEQMCLLASKIKKDVGTVHILINNAAVMNKAKTLMDLSPREITNIFNVNVLAHFWLCKIFLKDMIDLNYGHIVNISSSMGTFGSYKLTDYCSTKSAVNGFTESLRLELKLINKENNVNVSLVCPFHVDTRLFNGFKLPRLKWLETSMKAEKVALEIVNGILLKKDLIGCPSFDYFVLSAIKK